jgi:hypothetical protein
MKNKQNYEISQENNNMFDFEVIEDKKGDQIMEALEKRTFQNLLYKETWQENDKKHTTFSLIQDFLIDLMQKEFFDTSENIASLFFLKKEEISENLNYIWAFDFHKKIIEKDINIYNLKKQPDDKELNEISLCKVRCRREILNIVKILLENKTFQSKFSLFLQNNKNIDSNNIIESLKKNLSVYKNIANQEYLNLIDFAKEKMQNFTEPNISFDFFLSTNPSKHPIVLRSLCINNKNKANQSICEGAFHPNDLIDHNINTFLSIDHNYFGVTSEYITGECGYSANNTSRNKYIFDLLKSNKFDDILDHLFLYVCNNYINIAQLSKDLKNYNISFDYLLLKYHRFGDKSNTLFLLCNLFNIEITEEEKKSIETYNNPDELDKKKDIQWAEKIKKILIAQRILAGANYPIIHHLFNKDVFCCLNDTIDKKYEENPVIYYFSPVELRHEDKKFPILKIKLSENKKHITSQEIEYFFENNCKLELGQNAINKLKLEYPNISKDEENFIRIFNTLPFETVKNLYYLNINNYSIFLYEIFMAINNPFLNDQEKTNWIMDILQDKELLKYIEQNKKKTFKKEINILNTIKESKILLLMENIRKNKKKEYSFLSMLGYLEESISVFIKGMSYNLNHYIPMKINETNIAIKDERIIDIQDNKEINKEITIKRGDILTFTITLENEKTEDISFKITDPNKSLLDSSISILQKTNNFIEMLKQKE